MIIGIDGNEANTEKRVGIGEFAFELLAEIANFTTENKYVVYLKSKPRNDLPRASKNLSYKVFGPKRLWTQIGLPFRLFFGKKPDVFFTPTHYGPRFSPIPTVVSVMDLSFIHFPQLFRKDDLYQLNNWTAYSIKKAKKIITISKSSKDDIIKQYHVPQEKVVVVYPGIKTQDVLAPHIYAMHTLAEKYGIAKNFILYVGTLQPRKNIEKLIEAFAKVKPKDSKENDLQLVIAGKKGWMYDDILSAPEKYGVTSSVKFLDFVSEEDLSLLYQHAICFVLPSLYEGFGLPVLEAMKNGCPVITSNVSSLPEAGGDAALYIDPKDAGDITKAMQKLVDNPTLRKEMIEKGKKQVMKFSWKKAAQETVAILEQIGKNNER